MCVYVDIETSGLFFENGSAEIIRISALKETSGELPAVLDTFVCPENKLKREIVKLTGITNKDLKGAPKVSDALKRLKEFIGDGKITVYNRRFIFGFLNRFGSFCGIEFSNPTTDLYDILKEKFPNEPKAWRINYLRGKFNLPEDINGAEELRIIAEKLAGLNFSNKSM